MEGCLYKGSFLAILSLRPPDLPTRPARDIATQACDLILFAYWVPYTGRKSDIHRGSVNLASAIQDRIFLQKQEATVEILAGADAPERGRKSSPQGR